MFQHFAFLKVWVVVVRFAVELPQDFDFLVDCAALEERVRDEAENISIVVS